MKTTSFIYLLILSLIACQTAAESTFDRHGISFQLATGWTILAEGVNEEEDGYFLQICQEAWGTSGTMAVIWYEYETDVDSALVLLQDHVRESIPAFSEEVLFGSPEEGHFGRFRTKLIPFQSVFLEKKLRGNCMFLSRAGKASLFYRKSSRKMN
ncbi:MAG: hypothetical protein AAF206_05425 [Bacteroidota bacterium]